MPTINTDFNERLGGVIRRRRIMQGLSQKVVANALGVSFQMVQKYEKSINRVSVGALLLLAQALNTTPEVLINEACADDAPPEPRAGLSDRMRLETVRLISQLPPERQRIARNVIKGLAGEEAA